MPYCGLTVDETGRTVQETVKPRCGLVLDAKFRN